MKRWIVCLGLLMVVGSAGAYRLSGTIHGASGLALVPVVAVPSTFDTVNVVPALPFVFTYSFPNLAEGGYILFSYRDLNLNAVPDLDEPRGFYGGDRPTLFQLISDSAGVDIDLLPPSNGGFSGSVSYEGSHSGATLIQAFYTPDMAGLPHGGGVVLNNTGVGNYICPVDSFTTYYARAFMDLNGNLQLDADEPAGVYGGATPVAIEVEPTDFPQGIDITLEDPATASDPISLQPSSFTLSAAPNPFNSRTRITYRLPAAGEYRLTLYDVVGRQVGLLSSGQAGPGEHFLYLDGSRLSTGIYILCLESGTHTALAKLVLLK